MLFILTIISYFSNKELICVKKTDGVIALEITNGVYGIIQ